MTDDPYLSYRDAVAAETVADLVRLIPAGDGFLLVDEQFLDTAPLADGRTCLRFTQRNEPAAESSLLREFEDFRANARLRFVVVAWPALWWLKHYRGLADRIQSLSVATHVGDGYVVFELGSRDSNWFIRVRRTVRTHVPDDGGLLIVTRGDDGLLGLGGRKSWHFPCSADGGYAGVPANSEEAINLLDRMRAEGAGFLLIPGWARWWLDYYEGLSRHLAVNARLLAEDDDCLLFALETAS